MSASLPAALSLGVFLSYEQVIQSEGDLLATCAQPTLGTSVDTESLQ